MSKNYIYSTLSNTQNVVVYHSYPGAKGGTENKQGSSKPSVRQKVIHIHGGANVADHVMHTPRGAVTVVSDAELAELQKVACFKRWVDRGFITVEKSKGDADEVAKDMTAKDKSAQTTIDDHEERYEKGETSAKVDVEAPKRRRRAPAKKSEG